MKIKWTVILTIKSSLKVTRYKKVTCKRHMLRKLIARAHTAKSRTTLERPRMPRRLPRKEALLATQKQTRVKTNAETHRKGDVC